MDRHTDPRECVAWLLVRDGAVLAEKRKSTKEVMPGAVALPGGHMEPGETVEEALSREMLEEMEIVPLDPRYVCTLLHHSEEFRKLHYFVVSRWEGAIRNHEAVSLIWLPMAELLALDAEVDRIAVAKYLAAQEPAPC